MTAAEKTGSDWNAFTAFVDRGLLYSLSPESSCTGGEAPTGVSYLTELRLPVLGACQMQSTFKYCGLFLIHVLLLLLFFSYLAGFVGRLGYRN